MTLTSAAILAQQGSSTGKESIASWSAGEPVNTLAVSGGGQRIVALMAPTKLKVWDSTGKEVLSLQVNDLLNSVTISADGKRLACGSSTGKLWVWDVLIADGKEIFSVKGHGNSVRGVALSPDGTRIATASQDKTAKLWDAQTGTNAIKVWDAGTGKPLVSIKGQPGWPQGIAFSRDGKFRAEAARRTARGAPTDGT